MTTGLVSDNAFKLTNRFCLTRPALPHYGHNSFENALIQALFACEQFRVYVLIISEENRDLLKFKFLSDYFKRMAMGCDQLITIGDPRIYDREGDPSRYLSDLFATIFTEYRQTNQRYANFHSGLFALYRKLECDCETKKEVTVNYTTILFVSGRRRRRTGEVSVQRMARRYFDRNRVNRVFGYCRLCKNFIRVTGITIPIILIFELVWLDYWTMGVKFEDTIEVFGEQYTLIACINIEFRNTVDEYYCCYAKIGEHWYRFKPNECAKLIYEMPLTPSQLETAYLLFYQKPPNIPISRAVNRRVDNLIEPIETRPQYPYTGRMEPIDYEIAPPLQQMIVRQEEVLPIDLIRQSLGSMPGLTNREEGICYAITSLQALFHCEAFRVHILWGGHSGRFHHQLRQFFVAMSNIFQQQYGPNPRNYVPSLRIEFNQFYESFCLDEHKEFATYGGADCYNFIKTLIFALNDEIKDRDVSRQHMPEEFKQKASQSIVAWRQLIFTQCKSYLLKLFGVQRVVLSKCMSCHSIADYSFYHWIAHYLQIPDDYDDNLDIQTIVDNWSVQQSLDRCSQCNHRMCWYSKITRASNCLIFDLENKPLVGHTNRYYTVIHINESIYVCGQYYYCKAVLAQVRQHDGDHDLIFVRVGNQWMRFDEHVIEAVVMPENADNCVLPTHCYYRLFSECAQLAFYEKISPIDRQITESERDLVNKVRPQCIKISNQ